MNNFPIYYYQDKKFKEYANLGFPFTAPTAPSLMDNNKWANSLFSTSSNSSSSFCGSRDGNNNINNNNYDYYNVSYNKNYQKEPILHVLPKKFYLNIDVKRIIIRR